MPSSRVRECRPPAHVSEFVINTHHRSVLRGLGVRVGRERWSVSRFDAAYARGVRADLDGTRQALARLNQRPERLDVEHCVVIECEPGGTGGQAPRGGVGQPHRGRGDRRVAHADHLDHTWPPGLGHRRLPVLADLLQWYAHWQTPDRCSVLLI